MFYIANIEMSVDDESVSKQLLVYADSMSEAVAKLVEKSPSIYKISVEEIGDGCMSNEPYIHLPEDKNFIKKLHEANSMEY